MKGMKTLVPAANSASLENPAAICELTEQGIVVSESQHP